MVICYSYAGSGILCNLIFTVIIMWMAEKIFSLIVLIGWQIRDIEGLKEH